MRLLLFIAGIAWGFLATHVSHVDAQQVEILTTVSAQMDAAECRQELDFIRSKHRVVRRYNAKNGQSEYYWGK